MLGSHFYNETIRRNIIAFGTLFNNIELQKKDPTTGNVLEVEKVPLAYGPKNKFLTRLEQNPDVSNKVAITLPRLYFEMQGLDYDAQRKTPPTQKYKTIINDDGDEVKSQYVPVPYNFNFELGVIAKSQDEALQIVEQILPYFQPSFSVTINFIPDMDEKRDVPIVLNNISYEDEWDDSFLNRRYIVYTLQFSVKSYLYGPYSNAGIIRTAIINDSIGDLNVSRRTVTRTYSPKATEDKNGDGVVNAADDALITADDDFGFNEGITYY